MANRYWVGGTGTWDASSTANWSTTSGGASGASAPVAADNVFFDVNSGAGTCTTAAGAVANDVTYNSSTLGLALGSNITLGGAFTLTAGAINLSSYILTTRLFNSNTANTRSIAFGTGKITVTGNATTVWNMSTVTNFTPTGTKIVEFTYSGATGTRSIFHGTSLGSGGSELTALNISITAGADTVDMVNTGALYVLTLDFTGFAGTLNDIRFSIYGDLIFSSGMTLTASATATSFSGAGGTQNITTGGKTLDFPITFNGSGAYSFLDDFSVASGRTVTLTSGTLDGNGKNISLGSFALGVGTKTLTLGSGTWSVIGSGTAWNANTNVTDLTVSASTGVISMTSASAKTFQGGGKAWPTLNQGGTGALTIQQSNTFTDITDTVQPATITLTSGTTQTVTQFTASGTAGNLITLNASTAGSRATISRTSGLTNVSYVDVKDINATGVAFYSYLFNGNVNSGNNAGIRFNLPDTSFIPSLFI